MASPPPEQPVPRGASGGRLWPWGLRIQTRLIALAVPAVVATVALPVIFTTARQHTDEAWERALEWHDHALVISKEAQLAAELVVCAASPPEPHACVAEAERLRAAHRRAEQLSRTFGASEREAEEAIGAATEALAGVALAGDPAEVRRAYVRLAPRLEARIAEELKGSAEAVDRANGTRRRAGFAAVVLGLLIVGVALFLSHTLGAHIHRSLQRLRQGAEGMAAGDLSTRVPADGGDELASVATALNGLAQALQASELAIARRTAELESSRAELAGSLERERRMQQQLVFSARMASVGTLAAGVAHEVNNPLAFVVLGLEQLRAGLARLPASGTLPLEQALEDVETGVQRIRATVRDLKIFARAEEDAAVGLDLRDVVRSSVRMAHNQLRHVATVHEKYDNCPAVHANGGRLGQVVLNLLLNAGQAMPKGASTLGEIHVATGRAASGSAFVEVRDTGCGIAPEAIGRIFDPFFTTKPVGVGSGLGLSICHGIVTGYGGTIEVDSSPGRGSRFRVLLPASTEPSMEMTTPTATPPVQRGQPRALVVDDEELVGKLLGRLLARTCQVTVTHDAHEALRLLGAEPFDLVFCDLMMPGLGGPAIHAEVLATKPALAARIVFMTGGAFTDAARDFLERVPNRCIEKPFDSKVLEAIVREASASDTGPRPH